MNQRKFVLFIAASLDGYIATKEHSLDWLFAVDGEGDNGISKFYDTVDTILIGRTTYDWVMEQEKGNFPYKDKECYVFSRTERNDNQHVKIVDEIIITIAQVLIGEGIPLFRNTVMQMRLSLKNMKRYNQFVELNYDVVRE